MKDWTTRPLCKDQQAKRDSLAKQYSKNLSMEADDLQKTTNQLTAAKAETMTNQINGYFVFAVSDCDWVVAKTADEAKAFYRTLIGDEADEYMPDELEPMTAEELDRYTYHDDDGKRSFAKELERRAAAGNLETDVFATTDN